MEEFKPHIDRIKKEHGQDKLRHQQEVSKLYKSHGINPAAGCLPLILQIPVFIALYRTLTNIVDFNKADYLDAINSKIHLSFINLDKIPDTSFIGFHLADRPNQWAQIGLLILAIPLITGILQYIQSKMLIAPNVSKVLTKAKEKKSMEDAMASMQSQMTLIMPAMIAFFSYGFPVGLSLYWNTFTVFCIIQQYLISGAGSLNQYLPKKWQKQS